MLRSWVSYVLNLINSILIGHLLSEVPPYIKRMNSQQHMPSLYITRSVSCQEPVHKFMSQLTKVILTSRRITSPVKTKKLSGMTKQHKQTTTKRNSRGIMMRRVLCCILSRKGVDLPLRRSFLWSVVSNVAFCHHFLQMTEPKQGLSQTPAAMCLQNHAAPQTANHSSLPFWQAVRESQTLLMRLRASMGDWSGTHSLRQQLSTSSSVWKKRSCSKEMWGKGAEGLRSNTVMFPWVTLICAQLKVMTVTQAWVQASSQVNQMAGHAHRLLQCQTRRSGRSVKSWTKGELKKGKGRPANNIWYDER